MPQFEFGSSDLIFQRRDVAYFILGEQLVRESLEIHMEQKVLNHECGLRLRS